MKPVTVSIDVPQSRDRVYEFLDRMANHEPFTDHMLHDWEYSGPERGVGAKARVKVVLAGRTEAVEIEVVQALAPTKIVERNVGAGGRRVGSGTYTLADLPGGGTRVTFEYSWQSVPLSERIAAPLVRAVLRRGNERALQRLAQRLTARDAAHTAAPTS